MDADLPSTRLVSQPQMKPHLPDPSGWHIPPGSPSCHCASVPPAASSLQLGQCTCPSASKGHHSREHGGSRALAHGGSQRHHQDPQSVCVLVAGKCLSPSSDTGTAAVTHIAQGNVGHDTTTPVLFRLPAIAPESQPRGTGQRVRRPGCMWLQTGHSTSVLLLFKLLQL